MNQQEIDRLFEQHSAPNNDFEPVWIMNEQQFTQAAAEIRRQALEEAAKIADTEFSDKMYHIAARNAGIGIAEAIRALAQPNGGTE